MEKSEKKLIKSVYKDILDIKAEALRYSAGDFDNSEAVYRFAKSVENDINWFINILIIRNVNENVIEQLNSLNIQLFMRNIHLC